LLFLGLLSPAIGRTQSAKLVAPYVTRAEAVTILLLARSGQIPLMQNQGQVRDIAAGQWYEHAMLAGLLLGIVQPDGATQELRPNEILNRAEFLKMLSAAFELHPSVANFQDVPGDAWYAPFAGLTRQYLLFPEDDDLLNLKPTQLLTFHETILAVQAILDAERNTIPKQDLLTRVHKLGDKSVYLVLSGDTPIHIAEPEELATLTSPQVARPSAQQMRTQVLSLVNQLRTRSGLQPLTYHTQLNASAQKYAEDMARRGFFSHVSPSGEMLKDRVTASGYYDRSYSSSCFCVKGFAIGENLARGQKTAQAAVDSWMKSPKHRAAILNADYTQTGIGVMPESALWVQHFGGLLLPGQEVIGG
jgi:uncharacterized protein YkwD